MQQGGKGKTIKRRRREIQRGLNLPILRQMATKRTQRKAAAKKKGKG